MNKLGDWIRDVAPDSLVYEADFTGPQSTVKDVQSLGAMKFGISRDPTTNASTEVGTSAAPQPGGTTVAVQHNANTSDPTVVTRGFYVQLNPYLMKSGWLTAQVVFDLPDVVAPYGGSPPDTIMVVGINFKTADYTNFEDDYGDTQKQIGPTCRFIQDGMVKLNLTVNTPQLDILTYQGLANTLTSFSLTVRIYRDEASATGDAELEIQGYPSLNDDLSPSPSKFGQGNDYNVVGFAVVNPGTTTNKIAKARFQKFRLWMLPAKAPAWETRKFNP